MTDQVKCQVYLSQSFALSEWAVCDRANVHTPEPDVKHKEVEVAVVEMADTRVEPRAMMVHLQNTSART